MKQWIAIGMAHFMQELKLTPEQEAALRSISIPTDTAKQTRSGAHPRQRLSIR